MIRDNSLRYFFDGYDGVYQFLVEGEREGEGERIGLTSLLCSISRRLIPRVGKKRQLPLPPPPSVVGLDYGTASVTWREVKKGESLSCRQVYDRAVILV